jgi:hypothetical protein
MALVVGAPVVGVSVVGPPVLGSSVVPVPVSLVAADSVVAMVSSPQATQGRSTDRNSEQRPRIIAAV